MAITKQVLYRVVQVKPREIKRVVVLHPSSESVTPLLTEPEYVEQFVLNSWRECGTS